MTAAAKWWEGSVVALDTETTGTNPHTDRIVTASLVFRTPGQRPRTTSWVIDPGVPVPDEAAAVHGWTTDRLRAATARRGALRQLHDQEPAPVSPDGALAEIAGQVAMAIHHEVPVIVHNAAYDLTLLEAELARAGVDTISSRPSGLRGVIDPMVISKQHDPYRKTCYKAPGCDHQAGVVNCSGCRGGKGHQCGGCGAPDRKLESLCRHYGVPHTGAHDAGADALAAIRLAVRLAGLWPQIAKWRLPTLVSHQQTWRAEQMKGLRSYFDRAGVEHDGCCGSWPVHGACCAPVDVDAAAALPAGAVA